jgi:serine/threonine protein kinase
MTCRACNGAVPDEAQFCPHCGIPIPNASSQPTVYTPSPGDVTMARPELRLSRAVTPPPGSDPRIGGRFPPGTLLDGRYRIVGIIGKGGMGEVYRAEDLTLGQVVALKFLPPALVRDPEWLTRFRGEVRAARQVSHPNVCRVYDIGEADGQTFPSMEFIDGEDLATLLRRIGRIGSDKAAEIGRGLCAGLAAAHDKGVLHRDLKPANVLIDENGRVKLADFGLAAGELPDSAGIVGTPAYMAPELFDGASTATVRSDIYALGLVLYELFTGKPAFSGQSVADLARQHKESTPSTLTSVVAEIDPLADRIIRRCL